MTHTKRVEKKRDRINRRVFIWIPCAVIPVFAGLILLALSTVNETRGKILSSIGAEGFPPASPNDFLPLLKIARSLGLPG